MWGIHEKWEFESKSEGGGWENLSFSRLILHWKSAINVNIFNDYVPLRWVEALSYLYTRADTNCQQAYLQDFIPRLK